MEKVNKTTEEYSSSSVDSNKNTIKFTEVVYFNSEKHDVFIWKPQEEQDGTEINIAQEGLKEVIDPDIFKGKGYYIIFYNDTVIAKGEFNPLEFLPHCIELNSKDTI